MSQVQNYPTGTRVSKKVIIVILIIFLFFASAIFILGRYYQAMFEFGKELTSKSSNDSPVDLVKLRQDYQSGFAILINGYLGSVDSFTDLAEDDYVSEMIVITQETEQGLLELVVPTEYKDHYLASILALA